MSGPLEPYLTTTSTLPLGGRAGRGPVEAVVSLVRVVLVDVTEDVGPEVGIRDIRAAIPVVGSINPGGGGNLGTAL